MAWAVLGFDGTDAGAPARRMAARDRHLALITPMAEDGRLALGIPLLSDAGRIAGSLMLLAPDDRATIDAYLAAEPFAEPGVWQTHRVHPFRIAPLPYRRLPQPGEPVATGRTHTVIVAMDGTDDGAQTRRMAARERHLARVRPMAESGLLTVGGAILDAPGGRMIGSIAVTRHADDAAARAWMAEDPYVTGDVWREIALHRTRFLPLPYRPLPGTVAA